MTRIKILIYSPAFYPSVGGLENVVLVLAQEFAAAGHVVRLVCTTPSLTRDAEPFEIIRNPNPAIFFKLVKWCDIFFQANISLKGLWPLIFINKLWVVAHHGWYSRSDGRLGWQDHIKHWLLRFAAGISISRAVADHISTPSTVIPDPYDDDVFYEMPAIERDKELIFVGRLVSDKGADVLLEALAQLKQQGVMARLTIVGYGPEEENLREQAFRLRINDVVTFLGKKTGRDLVRILNAHRILVVPSKWNEPFGIVALEGIACGCVVVVSDGGGLKDAIGECGVTFPNGDVAALIKCLKELLLKKEKRDEFTANAKTHLSKHGRKYIAGQYLAVLEAALGRSI